MGQAMRWMLCVRRWRRCGSRVGDFVNNWPEPKSIQTSVTLDPGLDGHKKKGPSSSSKRTIIQSPIIEYSKDNTIADTRKFTNEISRTNRQRGSKSPFLLRETAIAPATR